MADDIHIRPLAASDDLHALTELLHRAYAPLAAAGMNFTAATQTPEVTAQRAGRGRCLVAVAGGRLAGTVSMARPYDVVQDPWAAAAPWLCAPDSAHLNQLAVDPAQQGRQLGRQLVAAAEDRARAQGFAHMVLDTAEPAAHLRAWYARLGYTEVGAVQWQGKNYRTIVLRKALSAVGRQAAEGAARASSAA